MGGYALAINVRILTDSGRLWTLCVCYKCANPNGFGTFMDVMRLL